MATYPGSYATYLPYFYFRTTYFVLLLRRHTICLTEVLTNRDLDQLASRPLKHIASASGAYYRFIRQTEHGRSRHVEEGRRRRRKR